MTSFISISDANLTSKAVAAYDVWICGKRLNIQVKIVRNSQLYSNIFQVIISSGYGPNGRWRNGNEFAEDLLDNFKTDIPRLGIYKSEYIIRQISIWPGKESAKVISSKEGGDIIWPL